MAEAMAWCRDVKATVRFHHDEGSPMVRVAVHTDPRDVEVITASTRPVASDSAANIAQALAEARMDIAAQTQRAQLRLVE